MRRYSAIIRILTAGLAYFSCPAAEAEGQTPTIRAHSRVVTIRDGLHHKRDYWYVMPERSPDVYYAEIPLAPHTVTFVTDLDSIAIPVTYGSRTQFVILLDDGVEALTEVRAEFRKLLSPAPAFEGTPQTIPFRLGDNDKIYVQGRINGSAVLDLQFDLGAGGSLLKRSSVPKVPITFDDSITLHNSDGSNVVPWSSTNRLEIAGLSWSGVDVAVADNMTRREDGIIGNSLFRDKVVEINYERMMITIHDSLPALSPDWVREDIFLDGGTVPFVRGSLSIGSLRTEGWYMLDTGAYTSILSSPNLNKLSKFAGEFRDLFGSPEHPQITLAGSSVSRVNYSVRSQGGDPSDLGLLGNDVLKRFDLILDNRAGVAYFRPNGNMEAPFRNPERMTVRLAGSALLIAGVLLGVQLIRK